jgi:glycosyltransferase involved in cell wall biosynthesis
MISKKSPKVFYCGMVNTKPYGALVGGNIEIAANSIKMVSVVRALRDVGRSAILISMPVLGRFNERKFYNSVIIRSDSIPQIFFFTVANPYLRKFVSLVQFGWFCLAKVKRRDKVILYNHAFEYIAGLMILRLKGIRPILDIEDMPRNDSVGLINFIDRLIFLFFFRFTNQAKVLVSKKLATRLDIKKFCVVYGAVRTNSPHYNGLSASERFQKNNPLRVLYGGTLVTETGLDLFCGALKILIHKLKSDFREVDFFVTGFGGQDSIENLKNACEGTAVAVNYLSYISPDEYLEVLKLCDAALCLKMPESEITQTTFPSKVVEITTNGLLLISTDASDVPHLFSNANAIILTNPTSESLSHAIYLTLRNKSSMKLIAERGQQKALELFESKLVGARISDFLNSVT